MAFEELNLLQIISDTKSFKLIIIRYITPYCLKLFRDAKKKKKILNTAEAFLIMLYDINNLNFETTSPSLHIFNKFFLISFLSKLYLISIIVKLWSSKCMKAGNRLLTFWAKQKLKPIKYWKESNQLSKNMWEVSLFRSNTPIDKIFKTLYSKPDFYIQSFKSPF